MALKNSGQEVDRVNIDVADYKKQRAHRLEEHAVVWLEEVKRSGKPKHLEPMNAADRRTIHRLAGENGLQTASEGFGRDRHIVLAPISNEGEEAVETPQDAVTEEAPEETPVLKDDQAAA
jgi:spoIIIJ-associated protein